MNLKPIDVDQFYRLHFLLGSALWQCQSLEYTLCHFIVISTHAPLSLAESEAAEIMGKLQKKTFGMLLSQLKEGNTTNSVSSIQARFDKLVDERNWLAHNSWREHHADLYTPDKLPTLFARLEGISAEAAALRGVDHHHEESSRYDDLGTRDSNSQE